LNLHQMRPKPRAGSGSQRQARSCSNHAVKHDRPWAQRRAACHPASRLSAARLRSVDIQTATGSAGLIQNGRPGGGCVPPAHPQKPSHNLYPAAPPLGLQQCASSALVGRDEGMTERRSQTRVFEHLHAQRMNQQPSFIDSAAHGPKARLPLPASHNLHAIRRSAPVGIRKAGQLPWQRRRRASEAAGRWSRPAGGSPGTRRPGHPTPLQLPRWIRCPHPQLRVQTGRCDSWTPQAPQTGVRVSA
jgi:hypothetical protein